MLLYCFTANRLSQFLPVLSPTFLYYLTQDITADCICKIYCLALDGFDLNTVHKVSSKEKISRRSQDLNLGLLVGKQECFHCAMQPSFFALLIHEGFLKFDIAAKTAFLKTFERSL